MARHHKCRGQHATGRKGKEGRHRGGSATLPNQGALPTLGLLVIDGPAATHPTLKAYCICLADTLDGGVGRG